MNYEIRKDPISADKSKSFYIRESYPSSFITDNASKSSINKTAKALRQLGHTCVDLTMGN